MNKINDKIVCFLDPETIEPKAKEQLLNISELPGAYKDIDLVIENAKELVRVEHTFNQIINVKGD